jgi:hypothetical protein
LQRRNAPRASRFARARQADEHRDLIGEPDQAEIRDQPDAVIERLDRAGGGREHPRDERDRSAHTEDAGNVPGKPACIANRCL